MEIGIFPILRLLSCFYCVLLILTTHQLNDFHEIYESSIKGDWKGTRNLNFSNAATFESPLPT
jgi:hypothetical protein